MKKKMYNQPATEVAEVCGGYMMLDSVSPGPVTDPLNPPTPHAPRRGTLIPE